MSISRRLEHDAMLDVRRAYEDKGEPVKAIAARLNITESALRSRIYRRRWQRNPEVTEGRANTAPRASDRAAGKSAAPRTGTAGRGARTRPAAPPARPLSKKPKPAARRKPADRPALVRRLRISVEKEITSAEKLLAEAPSGNPNVERAARTLASLVRTLRELNALETPPKGGDQRDEEPPRDLDQLRHALAERLDRLRRERNG